MKSVPGMAIATGILLALTMFLNVWLVIWPNQKKVIANARNVQAGGEADPNAAAAGRKALLASRMNAIFSFTMLMFMVGTAHFFLPGNFKFAPSGSDRAIYWAIALIIWLVLELSALGVIGGTKPGGINVIFDTHKAALWTGLHPRRRVLRGRSTWSSRRRRRRSTVAAPCSSIFCEHGALQVALLRVVGDHADVAREALHLGREHRAGSAAACSSSQQCESTKVNTSTTRRWISSSPSA